MAWREHLLKEMLDIGRVLRAFQYSLCGIKVAVLSHTSFRQELIITVLLVPCALWIGGDGVEKALLISALTLVLLVELVNSAIETIVDRIGIENNELSKKAKDLGSAAVLISLVNVVVVWGLIVFD